MQRKDQEDLIFKLGMNGNHIPFIFPRKMLQPEKSFFYLIVSF